MEYLYQDIDDGDGMGSSSSLAWTLCFGFSLFLAYRGVLFSCGAVGSDHRFHANS